MPNLTITTLHTAFYMAVFTGVLTGAAVGGLRKLLRDPNESTFPWVLYGGILAAFAFGAAVAFDGMVHFLLWENDPTSPRAMFEFSALTVVLFAWVALLIEGKVD